MKKQFSELCLHCETRSATRRRASHCSTGQAEMRLASKIAPFLVEVGGTGVEEGL